MSKLKITEKELRAIGFPQGPVISIAMIVIKNCEQSYHPSSFRILFSSSSSGLV